jgi:hypothetical protein
VLVGLGRPVSAFLGHNCVAFLVPRGLAGLERARMSRPSSQASHAFAAPARFRKLRSARTFSWISYRFAGFVLPRNFVQALAALVRSRGSHPFSWRSTILVVFFRSRGFRTFWMFSPFSQVSGILFPHFFGHNGIAVLVRGGPAGLIYSRMLLQGSVILVALPSFLHPFVVSLFSAFIARSPYIRRFGRPGSSPIGVESER